MTNISSRIGTLILAVVFLLSCCCFDTAVVFADDPDYSGEPVRLLDEECDLNSKLYDNGDHTRTLYVYAEDIKYIDESGNIRDKDITVKKHESGGYAMTDNDVKAYFPATIKDGIRLEYKKYKLITKPAADTDAEASLEDGFVVYSGDGISYRYLSLYSGIEEFTVLDNYSGISKFRYSVSTENLILSEKDGAYYYTDSETGEVIFNVSDAVITDSEGKMSLASVSFDACDGGYILTVSADDSFLRSASYPVTIDPSYTVNTAAGIEDTTIYQGSPNLNTGSWTYNHAGYVSGYGVGRTLVRIPGLYNSTVFQSLNASQIISAEFTIKEATGSAPQTVKLHPYYGTAWTEAGATWNNTSPNSYLAAIDSESMSYGNSSTFNVLSLVRGWRTGLYTASKGFILINQNETDSGAVKALFSAETANIPYITITYENINNDVAGKTYFIRNNMSGQYIQMTSAGTVSMGNFTGELNQKWEFQDIGNGLVRIVSLSNETPTSGDHTYVLYSNFGGIVSAHYGQTPYTTYPDQCWICVGSIGGMRLKSVNYPGKSMYHSGTGVQISDESVLVTSYWSLIECSNPYKLQYTQDSLYNKINDSSLKNSMNCYAFASCMYDNDEEKLQPGEVYNYFYQNEIDNYLDFYTEDVFRWHQYEIHYYHNLSLPVLAQVINTIIGNVNADLCAIKGFENTQLECVVSSSANETMTGPWRNVALVLDYEDSDNDEYSYCFGDYHWYVLQEDGNWCHKPGLTNAKDIDFGANPETCNKKYLAGCVDNGICFYGEYEFIGYYKIKADSIINSAFPEEDSIYEPDNVGDNLDNYKSVGVISASNNQFFGKIEYISNDFAYTLAVSGGIPSFSFDMGYDVDVFEFSVSSDGYYSIWSDYYSHTVGVIYENDTYLNFSDSYLYYGCFYMTVYLTAQTNYKIAIMGETTTTISNYSWHIE